MHKELEEAKRNGEDTLPIYEKYAEISKKNREEAIAKECSGDPFCASGALAETQAGTDIVKGLSRLSAFSDLSGDELAQLTRFVMAENEESAQAIYQALPDYVKAALYTKEAAETMGLGAAVGGKGLAALGVVGKNQAAKGTTGNTTNQLTPDNFIADVTKHNTQLGIINAKKTGIAGAHKQDAFLESVEMTGAKINLKVTDKSYPGLIEYQYQMPSIAGNGPNAGKIVDYKKVQSKTTYDPKILSDEKVANMSTQAAKQSESYFLANPAHREYSVKVDGYWFQVTRDAKTGNVSNAFTTMPPRNAK
ncbi:CdiA family toxin C-terminal domain-containing protein [Leminorella grimontii]|uniref:CdiA family toxin C-terminal domain-containing protein n=1 Tax=Leminorella grimontii TaxID=82981 RepID=UPI00321FACE3